MEFEIKKHIAVLSNKKNWQLELNIVKWGENPDKLDVRQWNEDHTKCSKGLTLTEDEAKELLKALKDNC